MRVGLALAITAILVGSASAQVLRQEPPMGTLREGQRVLVDDGTCGPGKIKEVKGGNHFEVGGFKRVKRTQRCIPRR